MKKLIINRILILVVLPLFWSSTFLGTKICLTELPPIWLGAIRYLLSSLLFLSVLVWKGSLSRTLKDFKSNWYLFVGVGLIGTFFASFFQNIGLQYTTASASALMSALEPVLVAILSFLILKERLPLIGVIGVIIAFGGGFILITNGNPMVLFDLSGTVQGNLLVFLSILSYAFYTIFSKMLLKETDPLSAVTFSTIVGTIFLIGSALVMEDFPQLTAVSSQTWLGIVYLAIFPTCIALFLFNQLLTRVDASRTTIILFLIPIYGLILGMVLLGERLSNVMILGGLISVLGVWLIEYGPIHLGKKALKAE